MDQIVLIPGLLCDQTVWEPLLPKLGDRAVVADLSTQDDITAMAQDCLALCSGQIAVAGHSMGARVAIEIARLAPERLTRLALLDTGTHSLREGEIEKRRALVTLAHDQGMAALAERWLPGMVYEPNRQNADLMKRLTDMVMRMDPDLHERQITALINRPNAAENFATISCPVLLVVGEQDEWSPVSQHQAMQRLLPGARLEVVQGAGHFAPVERPDIVTPILSEFLRS